MAHIIERKRKDGSTAYLAQIAIKRKGQWAHRESRTFDKKPAANAWLKKRMKEIDAAGEDLRKIKAKGKTLRDALDKYLDTAGDKIGATKAQVLRTIRDEYDLSDKEADEIQSSDIVQFAQEIAARPGVASAATVQNYLSHLSAVFRISRSAWSIPLDYLAMQEAMHACKRLQITAKSRSRDRRPTLDELEALLAHFMEATAANPRTMPMHKVTLFALFSSRRESEITRARWDGLDQEHSRVFVKDMKHPGQKVGNDVWCDLPEQALKIAKSMPRKDDRVFPFNPDTICTRFTRACKLLQIEDLRFHDLRHEGISRLFEMGNSIPQVAAVSGHRSWASLQRYTHLRQTGDKYEGWEWIDRVCRA